MPKASVMEAYLGHTDTGIRHSMMLVNIDLGGYILN